MNNQELSLAIKTIAQNTFTIITAPTGTGKSTQIPLEILRQGISVITTESRILAAKSLSSWVSKLNNSKLGEEIGYNTGMGSDYDKLKTECLYRTDGTELRFRFLQTSTFQVLIIDEVHEWNHNQELLIALAHEFVEENPQLHVVIMSATLNAKPLSKFLNDAPIIELKGFQFPIIERKPVFTSLAQEANMYIKEDKNVLAFVAGKSAILKCIEELKDLKCKAEIIPLHSEQTHKEQQKAFIEYTKPKIVIATDVAQSAITIHDIDVIITSGVKRTPRVVSGVVGLYYERISQFDEMQQKGRCGRTKAGIFTCMYDGDEVQNQEPIPLIQVTPIAQQTLLLLSVDRDIRTVDYFHKPSDELIDQAFDLLYKLDAIDENYTITQIGKCMSHFSVKPEIGRMIVEAHDLGVLPDVIKIGACIEVGGIQDSRSIKWKKGINNTSSDLIGQLELFNQAISMKSNTQLKENGIHIQKFNKALELCEKIWRQINFLFPNYEKTDKKCNKSKVIQACVTGLKHRVYKAENGVIYGDDVVRKISRQSTIAPGYTGWIIGIPFDLEINTDIGAKMLYLLTMSTYVTDKLLAKIGATAQNDVIIYRYIAEQDLILISQGNQNEFITTWDKLIEDNDESKLENIRKQIINQQFRKATDKYSGSLKGVCLGEQKKLIGKKLSKEPYGVDPKTRKILYAYPAYIFKFNKTYIKFFQTEQARNISIERSLKRVK